MVTNRKKEAINVCLDHFIENGLAETSTRSLSSALRLQNAGLYYYFESKDEVVMLCAEEAVLRLETNLIIPAIKDIIAPDIMIKRLRSRAEEMASTMRFFVSVCSNARYKDEMKPILDRLSKRCETYVVKIANALNCNIAEVAPYVYMTITATANYMIFSEKALIQSQLDIVKEKIIKLHRCNYRTTVLVKYGKLLDGCPNEQKVAWQF